MIVKERMRFGITLFGKDFGFFYDVYVFVPSSGMTTPTTKVQDTMFSDSSSNLERELAEHKVNDMAETLSTEGALA